jgi:hypothetical protein
VRRPSRLVGAAAVLALATTAFTSGDVVPDAAPDRGPVLSEFLERGELVTTPAAPRAPRAKTIDGRVGDWVGAPSRIAGTSRYDRGEHVHSDFVLDAWGADDGSDRDRWAAFGETLQVDQRTRRIDNVARTSGSQLGVPEPIGAPDEYGDLAGGLDTADLVEVRWAARDTRVDLLARTANLTDPSRLGVLVLADRGDRPCSGAGADATCDGQRITSTLGGFGFVTDRYDTAVLLTAGQARGWQVTDGALRPAGTGVSTAVDASGWTNALEARLPRGLVADGEHLDVAVIAGLIGDDGSFTPANIAYRHHEPIDIYNDREQAFALLEAADRPALDAFSSGPIRLDWLRNGRTEQVRPGPGYHERVFASSPGISREQGMNGIWQHYGLLVPSDYDPAADAVPLTFWLHYRGGKAHSGAAINPRLITQLGEERSSLVVTPRARGTSEWYVTDAHQDVFEVFADVHDTFANIDPARRYLSGYSMGGYGTYLFGLLYPDLFAAGYSSSGAVTQGAWVGTGPDGFDPLGGQGYIEANDGDADAQLTYRLLENARHFPLAIDHGTNDELVPVTGVQRMGVRLAELGYRYELTMFDGYEHFTQAAVDEWVDGADYLHRFALPDDVGRVTYKVVPALTRALNTVRAPEGATFDFRPDGAWWVDGIEPRTATADDPSTFALVDATSHALPEAPTRALPVTGVASPPGHSTPYQRHGLDHIEDPLASTPPARNAFTLDLTDVASVELDAGGMGLDATRMITATVTTDGPSVVRLVTDRGTRTLQFARAGTYERRLLP